MAIVTLGDLLPAVVERFNQNTSRDAWQPATYYGVGRRRVAHGQRWECITAGVSAPDGSGPTTPGPNVTDGSVHWKWLSAAVGTSSAPITSILGEQGEGQNDAPPRLVWVPTRDTFGAATRIGPAPQGRSVRARHASVDCHVWGPAVIPAAGVDQAAANLSAAEQILNDLLAAVHEELRGGLAPDGRTWWSRGCAYELGAAAWQTKGTLMQHGCECIVEITFALPVLEPAPARVVPQTITLTESIEAPAP